MPGLRLVWEIQPDVVNLNHIGFQENILNRKLYFLNNFM